MKRVKFEKMTSTFGFFSLLLICLNLIFNSSALPQPSSLERAEQRMTGQEKSHAGQLSISGAWALYPLAVRWVEEYQK
ncbi:MAG TPA: hypothetical protein PKV90_08190, partial [Candidatus Saccharicenans sp.]|nr:hypothetical protein [Candidatus Saccharicenans sp.]HQH61626.1 hypothetical protein [Candidatus Saccharicenans sp.]HQI23173.1 hypothetical protein [Candidatus Saccharicenans sp.]